MSSSVSENEVTPVPANSDVSLLPSIVIRPNFNCTIRANTNTFYYSKAPIRLLDKNKREIARATFVGQGIPGVVVPMKVQSSGAYEWTFKPAPEERSIEVNIQHGVGEKGPFESSQVTAPIQIQKKPEDGKIYQEFYFTIILSEDWQNNTWDDAVITVVQWK